MSGNRYVDIPSIVQMIGCIIKNPSLLDEDGRYFFSEKDFTTDFHKVVFGSIFNLHEMGAEDLSIQAIEDYLQNRPKSLATYNANNGHQWIVNIVDAANTSNFDYYYNKVKKMTLLREYDNIGFDVSWIYDPDNLFDLKKKQEQENKLDSLDLIEISDLIETRVEEIRRQYVDNSTDESVALGDGIFEYLEELETAPDIGAPLYGKLVNTITRGARLGKFYLRSGATNVGKAICNDTIIPTLHGLKRVDEIRVGDYLFDAFGKPTKVLGVFPQGKQDVWEVKFKDGRIAKCSPDHLWSYCTAGQKDKSKIERKFYTNTLKEISRSTIKNQDRGYNILVPRQYALQYEEKKYSIDPYVLGLILGDGSFRYNKNNKSLSFSSADEELPKSIAKIMNYNYKKNSQYNYSWSFSWKENSVHKNVWVEEILKDYPDLWNKKSEDKFIPEEFLYGSIQQRLDLLNGLLDTDGTIDKRTGSIIYTTISPYLRDGIIQLAEELGFSAKYSIDTHKDTHICYNIIITGRPEDKLKLFRLKRKRDILELWYNNKSKKKEKNEFNPIVSITNLNYQAEMTCFLVDNKEHLFLMNDCIVTHNTRLLMADACNFACDKIYDTEKQEWIDNGLALPALFISTEQENIELKSLALSFIAGVNEEHILTNKYEFGEKERVIEAAKILQKSPLYVEELPDFSLKDIENVIKRNIRLHAVQYIMLDYIHTSIKILEEITRRSGGVRLREDNILFLLSVKLKDICNQFNVFIYSATQLNQDWATSDRPDQNLLRGAKAIADKIDLGSIMLDVTPADKEALRPLIEENGYTMPNIKMSIYKNRRGSYNHCYLWMNADKGTCRFNGLFCTDYQYNLIYIKDMDIQMQL